MKLCCCDLFVENETRKRVNVFKFLYWDPIWTEVGVRNKDVLTRKAKRILHPILSNDIGTKYKKMQTGFWTR